MSADEFINEKLNPVFERMNDSLFGSYIFSFLVVNYDVLVIIFYGDLGSRTTIDEVAQRIDRYDMLWPALCAILYVLYKALVAPSIKLFIHNKSTKA